PTTNTIGGDVTYTVVLNTTAAVASDTFTVTATRWINTGGCTGTTQGTLAGNGTLNVVSAVANGAGTMAVSPSSVLASSTGNTVTFTFASASGSGFPTGSSTTVTVPSGWTVPTTGNTAVANATGTSCAPSRTVSGQVITISHACANGDSFTLTFSNVT